VELAVKLWSEGRAISVVSFEWVRVAELVVSFGLRFDGIAAGSTLVVTGVGSLVFLASIGRMAGDAGSHRALAHLHLIVATISIVALADDLILLLVGAVVAMVAAVTPLWFSRVGARNSPLDEIGRLVIARPLLALAGFCRHGIDRAVIDGTLHLVAHSMVGVGAGVRRFHSGRVRQYALAMALGALGLLCFLLLSWRG
jgi:NADH:ubiquinone oxidoreductase subunit 5 (subunit L)/multisubunit Na+/H+ antiporter MnhA subunit